MPLCRAVPATRLGRARLHRIGVLLLTCGFLGGSVGGAEARLSVTDKLSTYRRASSADRIDLANRLAKSFSALSPRLDRDYFIRCLEETVNIGDPRDLELDAAVRLCVAAVPE
ncbi:hypothetical protein BGCPKDLD_4790 [Methylorubrum suomiense]|uniref:UrcA family protein n=1 Tax=Methylorubrum suomiense TaxID=144191 RepID=A0ABQ4V270_9HYPH|nr:hypothetical protein BGCPKDLD_4790 [Methylorubrum suomiense]